MIARHNNPGNEIAADVSALPAFVIPAFFRTPERIAKLVERAEAWRGTPWRQNSMAQGAGVACHHLPRALYIESEALSPAFPIIAMTPQESTATNAMEKFLDGRPEFARLKTVDCGLATILQPGDMVGLFIPINNVGKRERNRIVNHLGVMLPNNCFAHVLMGRNTTVNDQIDKAPWCQTLLAAWRPME